MGGRGYNPISHPHKYAPLVISVIILCSLYLKVNSLPAYTAFENITSVENYEFSSKPLESDKIPNHIISPHVI